MAKVGVYDSKLERAYADRLELLKRAGEIRNFEHHPEPIEISRVWYWKKTKKDGMKCVDKIRLYTPDFLVTLPDGSQEYVEVKGYPYPIDVLRFEIAAGLCAPTRFLMVGFTKKKGWHILKEYGGDGE